MKYHYLSLVFVLFCLLFNYPSAQTSELWGMTGSGGAYNAGTIYKTNGDGTNETVEYSFPKHEGKQPYYLRLCEASNGKLYGVTSVGGANNVGVLFEFDPISETYTTKLDFDGANNGANPQGSLFQASNGKLYGMTYQGGANNVGVLFEYDPIADTYIKKHDFVNFSGQSPTRSFIEAANGKLYGVTLSGGLNNWGVLFEYDPSTNIYTKRVDFDGSNKGQSPDASLTIGPNGKLYGTTKSGGTNNFGVIFEYDPVALTYTKKYDLSVYSDGGNPCGSLIYATNGKFYGTTYQGGANAVGVLFKYDPTTNTYTKEFDFDGTNNGKNPYGSLMQASNGLLYGMTVQGGANNTGVLFEYDTTTNIFSKKQDFNSTYSGANPRGSLIQTSNGNIYGVTCSGGSNLNGSLFHYDQIADTIIKKIDFDGAEDGSNPIGALIQATSGKLYGMTSGGGTNNLGVLFEYDKTTNTYTKLLDFDGANNGSQPWGSLMQASNGMLYGMTLKGGSNNMGVIFEYNPISNTYTKKLDFFALSSGEMPIGSMIEASNGKLYGMTWSGGNGAMFGGGGQGQLFEYDYSTDTYTVKFSFDGTAHGMGPEGDLTEASNGKLYGMTTGGGTNSVGVIFEYDPTTSAMTKKLDFDGANYGSKPRGSFVLGSDNNLYALTWQGGGNNLGVFFKYDPINDIYTKILDLDGTAYGASPSNSLIKSANGKLYGVTTGGGVNSDGTLFEYDPSTNIYTKRLDFNGTNGSAPGSHLLEVLNCAPNSGTDVITACDSYTWIDGNTYTASNNTATWTLTNATGCDSVVTLDLTINYSNTGTDVITACDSYTWIDGNTYSASNNTATWTLTNATGCDSVVTLDLTINYSNTGTDVITACDSYTWIDGNTYTASNNTAMWTLTNAAGCDSVVTLDLTINYSNTGTDVITACDSYTWIDGNTYTASNNTAMWTLTNMNGCDSLVTLDLTINYSNTGTDVITACDSYTWIDGNTYTASNNTAMWTLTNAAGCDSVVTLDLTINYSNAGTDVITACDSYTWIDGNTYTASNNTATWTLTNAAGCDSVVTLDLTINYSNTGTDVITACDSYTWIDGNTYTASNNTAMWTLTNMSGCDSVVTLDLTINYSNTGTDVITACDSYTWIDGNTYTASNNTAMWTLTNAAGCDSVVTLDLTINYSNAGTDVITACDSYTWIDGNTYTASNNTAMWTLTNMNGCDSLVTLDLTINYSNTGTDVQTACDSYTWIDGNTYSASNNTATWTLTNAAGCDSVVTLDLTINYSNTGTDVITACDSYTWIDGNTYSASNNTATWTLTNATGCDSVVTLDLTINTVDNSVTQTGVTLDANAVGATYQWLDCNNNYSQLSGENNQSFTASVNGSYAVQVIENGCTDTSSCYVINNVGISDLSPDSQIKIYPNPTQQKITFSFGDFDVQTIDILDASGKTIRSISVNKNQMIVDVSDLDAGVYFVNIHTHEGEIIRQVIKQ